MNHLLSAVVRLVIGLNVTATIGIFALIMFTMTDVLGRILFNAPVTGVPELAKLSLVAITFLQMPYVMWQDRHIRSTVLCDRFSPRWIARINVITNLIGMVVFIMFFYGGWNLMVQAWTVGEYEGEGALRVPTTPNRVIMELGSLLMVVLCAWNVVKAWRGQSDPKCKTPEVV